MIPPSDPGRDLELVRSVLRGEAEARRELVERMRVVGRLLAARNRSRGRPLGEAELEDLAQDVLLVAWRKLAGFAGESAFEGWLHGIAGFEFLNAVRRRGRERRDVQLSPELAADAPRAEDGGDALDRLLRHLTGREVEVVRLRHVERLTFAEIGTLLELSPSSAKTHYYRGIEKLRGVLAGKAGGTP